MASQPFKRALFARIKERGGWSALLARIADVEPLSKIAPDYGCSRSFLSHLLCNRAKPKLMAAYQAAKIEAAHAHAELGLQELADASLDRDSLTKAKQLAEYRKWLAGVYDRETFAQPDKAALVHITVGELHLKALQAAKPLTPTQSPPALPPAEAQIEEDEDGTA